MRQLAWVQGVMLLIAIALTVMFKNGMGGSESMVFWSWLAHGVVFLLYVAKPFYHEHHTNLTYEK